MENIIYLVPLIGVLTIFLVLHHRLKARQSSRRVCDRSTLCIRAGVMDWCCDECGT